MPDRFHVVYSPVAGRDLEKLPPAIAERIQKTIEDRLSLSPFHYGKKLAGATSGGQWRFRVGDYRVRFDFVGSNRLLILRIRHRREVYGP